MNMSVEEDSCSHQPQNGVSQGRGGMEQEGGDKGVVKGSGQSREMFLRAGATALGIFAAVGHAFICVVSVAGCWVSFYTMIVHYMDSQFYALEIDADYRVHVLRWVL